MYIRKLTSVVSPRVGVAEAVTPSGVLRGVLSEGTYVFRGIEYATAERFHAPKKPAPWEGVKEAIVYGNACPEPFTVVPHDQYTVPHYFTVQSEDCQYLNVWTQHINEPDVKRPVMIWFHGGGMTTGSGVEHYAYDGEEASRFNDVVVVTLNHRLNVLGFLDLSAYGEEYRDSGNAGLLDLIAALEWVRDNISAFGGDPENVMIFGQSGGGGKVCSMLQSKRAAGLFKRAVLQSGGMRYGADQTKEQSQKLAAYVLEELGIDAENMKEIETIWYDRLSEAATRAQKRISEENGGKRVMFGPVVDNDIYCGHPFNVGFIEETKDVAVLCGNVYGEFMQNFNFPKGEGMKSRWTEEYAYEMVQDEYGEKTDEVIAAFKAAYPERPIQDVLFTDIGMRKGAYDFALLRAKQSDTPCYNFLFNLESPLNGGTLPWHNAEIPHIFHNADYLEPSFVPGVTGPLQDMISRAWANFAGSGDPNGTIVSGWKPFTEDARNTMIFDRVCRMEADHDAKLRDVLPPRQLNISMLMGKKK